MSFDVRRTESGLTLFEVMVTVAIIAILASVAIPSYTDYLDRQRVKSAAEILFTDISFARSDALRKNTDIYVLFGTGTGSCYSLGEVNTCGCSCSVKSVTASAFSASFPNVQIDSVATPAAAVTSVMFSKDRGTSSHADTMTVVLKSTSTSRKINVSINTIGLPSICTPTQNVSGIANC